VRILDTLDRVEEWLKERDDEGIRQEEEPVVAATIATAGRGREQDGREVSGERPELEGV
jgi:hypothetical protein